MALSNFQEKFDNQYQEVFLKKTVAKEVMNSRFESNLKYGESVERFAYNIDNVVVRTVARGSASVIDVVTDTTELLTINLEREVSFHISDGEMKQAGPLNPAEVIGAKTGEKVSIDLDARCFGEVVNALHDFDNGDLTGTASTGVGITLNATTVPQLTSRMSAKLTRRNNISTASNMVMVVDSYAAADIEQYLMGKNIDLAGAVFQNGFAGDIRGAMLYVSENLTGEIVLTGTGVFTGGEVVVVNGITFTAVAAIGTTPGNFLIGANLAASLTNLAGLINAPSTTNATQVALSTADAGVLAGNWTAVATATTLTAVLVGSGRPIVSETTANASFTTAIFHAYYGKKGAIDLVMQDMQTAEMRPTSDRRGTNIFASYLAGLKSFQDGRRKFLDVLINA